MKIVTGLFTPDTVGEAVRSLTKRGGFAHDDLSIMSSTSEMPDYLESESVEDAASGATVGAVAGGTVGALGPLVASTIPGFETMFMTGLMTTTIGGVVGGYLGSLYNVRAKDQAAIDVHEELEAGKYLLVVKTEAVDTAVSLMKENGGQHVEIHTVPEKTE